MNFRTAFALWLIMNLLLVVVPRYGAYAMAVLGVTLCAAAGGYWASLPHDPLVVRLDGAMLFFSMGWCFWLVLIAGNICETDEILMFNFVQSRPFGILRID